MVSFEAPDHPSGVHVKPVKTTVVRRTLGIAAAVLAGLMATFVLATPASAHYSYIRGTASCIAESGTYSVNWSVWNSEVDKVEDLIVVTTDPAGGAGDIHVGATIPDHQGTLTGVQTGIPGNAHSASLSVKGHWAKDNFTEDLKTDTVNLDGNCAMGTASPSASATFACDGTAVVSVSNAANATHTATFTVTGTGFTKTTSALAAGDSTTMDVPASAAGDITVKVGNAVITSFHWAKPADCAAVKVASKSDCTSLTVSLENPSPNAPITATVVSGNTSKDVTIGTGKTELVSFPAGPGATSATVTFKDGAATTLAAHAVAAAQAAAPITLNWENPGAVCTPPELPKTGAKIGGVVGSGVALVGIGVGLLFYLRRRKARIAS
jgi:LPXTG-motif cell wall-anchored protein